MKKLKRILVKRSGRNSQGRVTVRHQGGRMKRYLRLIDFRRDKIGIWGKIAGVEYDPNRNVSIALTIYEDGEKRYTLMPLGLLLGARVISSPDAPIEVGNALPLGKIPAGTQIHNIEIVPGKGGQYVRGAGSVATVQGTENEFVLIRMPSGELRRFNKDCLATIGQVANPDFRSKKLGKAGRHRRMGIRPTVRGVAMHPGAHPHGGGEGRSSVGMKSPKTPWGKSAAGKTRLKRRYSNKMIIERRKKGKHS